MNGLPAYTDCLLPIPCKIEYYEPKFPLDEASSIYAQFSPDWIVWEDAWLIVTYKPSHLPTTPSKEQRFYNLKTYLDVHLKTELHFPSRLDMSTQGLVIASKHEGMHAPLQQLFEKREVQKKYLLFTDGSLNTSPMTVSDPIGKTSLHPVLRATNGKGAKEAVTVFESLCAGFVQDGKCEAVLGNFIEASPLTGRTHQIRVHAASIGCAVCGDKFYNGAISDGLCLLSHKLSFVHPFTEEKLAITVPERLCPDWARQALFNGTRVG